MQVQICDICNERIDLGMANAISFFKYGKGLSKAEPRIEICDSCYQKLKCDFVNGEGSFRRESR